MKVQITWSLIEVDRCRSCRIYKALWTNSHAHRFGDHLPLVACADCYRKQAGFNLRYPDETIPYDYHTGRKFGYAVLELIHNTAPVEVDTSQYPYLEALFKCDGCENYIPEGAEVLGVRQDNLEPLRLHRDCVAIPRCCGRTYASGWSCSDQGLHLSTASLEGNLMCRICLDEYLKENNETIEDDYFVCAHCDTFIRSENEVTWSGSSYCERCYDNNVYTCDDCNSEYWDGDDHDCSESYGGLIHDYSYKPRPYFFGRNDKERIFMGFELEVEIIDGGMREHAEEVTKSLGEHAYLKHDGSLEHGFEIVTHPHTLDSYRKEFAFESFRRFRRDGLRSWNTSTCGLHVHVSRSAFGAYDNPTRSDLIKSRQLHELRFIKLIYDNQRQVCRLAGRTSNSYANFQDKGNLTNKVIHGNDVGGRHAAVNTYNENTLEIRIFKGSLHEKRVLMALEFVHCAVEYTRDLKVNGKNKALSWLAFSGYVHTNQEQYPHLHEMMVYQLERDQSPNENE